MLLMTVILVLVGSLIVGGLSTFAVASLRALPTAKSRTTRIEAVKSATRMAMTLQRDLGPSGCFDDISSWTINGLPVTVSCATLDSYATGNDRYGVVTTAATNNVASLSGKTGGSTFLKALTGKLYLNAGLLNGTTADLNPYNTSIETSSYTSVNSPAARYRVTSTATPAGCTDPQIVASDGFATSPGTHTLSCTADPWWTRAGDMVDGSREYPLLSQVPTYVRDGSLATINSCKIFYPGRYVGTGTLSLSGVNYFASGVYYFEQPISIAAGATVVFGEGKYKGCVYDTDAAFAPSAPKSHEITGKGGTILLGKAATITVAGGAKLTINRRVSSASSRGTEGQAIHTVSFGVANSTVEIPSDRVKLADGSTQDAAAHQISIGSAGETARYNASTLTPSNTALQITLASNSDVLIDGYIFTPHAKVAVSAATGVTNYGLRLNGGIVGSGVTIDVANAPATASKWHVGMQTEVLQRKVLLVATALVGGHTVEFARRSRSTRTSRTRSTTGR